MGARTPEEKRCSIVHELIHAHLWRTEQATERAATIIGGDTIALMVAQVQHEGELAVDALSEAVAGYFPLPDAT